MLKLVAEYVLSGFRSTWKLYLTNVLSLLVILLLFAYLEGARRQLDVRNTVFSGEVVVRMKVDLPDVQATLRKGLPDLATMNRKIRAPVTYKAPGKGLVGAAELLGAELTAAGGGPGVDRPLGTWLKVVEGRKLEGDGDVLVPESLLADTGLAVGDALSIQGRTAGNDFNAAVFRICGAYQSAELGAFSTPRLILSLSAMEGFFEPRPQDVEYCLFFRGGAVPDRINALVSRAFDDPGKTKVAAIESGKVSVFDVLNISVQFNVFLVIVVFIAIVVMATVLILVNFNISTIVFRKRRKEIGTLMAFGSTPAAISLALALESLAQVLVCTLASTAACLAISLAVSSLEPGGSLGLLLTLLSGTNRLALSTTFGHVEACFVIMATAVAIAHAPVGVRVLAGKPITFLGAGR